MRLPSSSQCSATFLLGWTRRRLTRHLRVVGWEVQLPARQVLPQAQERFQGVGHVVDLRPGVTIGDEVGHRVDVELARVSDVGQLAPGHRRGHRGTRTRPQRPCPGHGPVPEVLVEVDEDGAVRPQLLPPGGGRAPVAALQLPAEADGCVAKVVEGPLRPDPDVDVDAAVAGGLREPTEAQFGEQLVGDGRDSLGVGERGTGLRVEVEPQLVGMLHIAAAHRPRVEGEGAHLCGPHR